MGYIPEYRRGYRNPPGKDMVLMGHKREANQPTRGWCAPPQGRRPNWIREGGATPLSFSYSLSFPPFPLHEKDKKGGEPY